MILTKQFFTRFMDICISIVGLIVLLPLIVIATLVCKIDTGIPFFLQKRVGLNKKPFFIIKFRTMKINAPSLPTHQVPTYYISPIGRVIRDYKIDEIPQLINVLRGDMSIVGPRPCLYSQEDIINRRSKLGLYNYRPGITGLAQINKVDMSMPNLMVDLDFELMSKISTKYYLFIIAKTIISIIK